MGFACDTLKAVRRLVASATLFVFLLAYVWLLVLPGCNGADEQVSILGSIRGNSKQVEDSVVAQGRDDSNNNSAQQVEEGTPRGRGAAARGLHALPTREPREVANVKEGEVGPTSRYSDDSWAHAQKVFEAHGISVTPPELKRGKGVVYVFFGRESPRGCAWKMLSVSESS